jgi:hypothetical protein
MTTRRDFLKAKAATAALSDRHAGYLRSRRPDIGEETIDLTGEVLRLL